MVVLAVIPALVLTLFVGIKQKRQAAEQANREYLNVTKMVASEQERVLSGTKQLLGVLVHLPEVRSLDPVLCDPLLASLLKNNPLYANFGVVDRNGMLTCSALPFSNPINDTDRMWFRRATETRSFAVGDYVVSRTAHFPTLHCACPFFDDEGNILGVAFAALDLRWESQLLASAHLPEGTVATLLDSSGNILARSADPGKWVGQSVTDTPFIRSVLTRQKEGTAESPGIDGVIRLYAFTPLKESGGSIVGYLILGIPPDMAYANSNRMMVRSLIFLGAVGAFAVLAAWVFTGAFVLRRTRDLLAAVNRLRAGDLTSRTEPDDQFGEFTDLAIAFDEMADTLERRIAELDQAHAQLFLDEVRLQAQLKLNSMIEAPLKEIADFAIEEAVRLTRSEIGYLAFMNADESVETLHSWSNTAGAEYAINASPAITHEGDAGLWEEAVRQRKVAINNDCQPPDPLNSRYPGGGGHVTRHMNVPVFEGDRIVIVAGVCNKEMLYDGSDARQLTLLVHGLWGLIQRQNAERELKQHREQLEQLVDTRTAELKEINEALSSELIERKRIEEALQLSEKRTKELLASVTDYIYTVHIQNGSVTSTSHGPGCLSVTGYSLEDYANDPYLWYRVVHPDDRPTVVAIAAKMASGAVMPPVEHRILHRDGSIRWVRNQRVLRYLADGQFAGYDGLISDITERKIAEEALRKALANLQKTHEELKASQMLLINTEKLEITGRLAAGVAHEVKNPLAILAMSLDYLSRVLPDMDEAVLGVLKDMRDAIRRADTIILGLLEFSASEKLELQPGDLNSVIEKAALLVKHNIKLNSVEIVKNLALDLPPVALDQNKAVQAFVNILANAVDAMPHGGLLTVRSYHKQPSNNIRDAVSQTSGQFSGEASIAVVEIEDNGSGIAPDKLPKIFDPFFTTKSPGKGTGLGLTVTRKIIELHGGSLQITNKQEGGVRVLLLFPALKA